MCKIQPIFVFFLGILQPGDPSFPPELSPARPLLSPQNSTTQNALLQQAQQPAIYQSPDMNKNWQQTEISNNRYWMRHHLSHYTKLEVGSYCGILIVDIVVSVVMIR